MDDFVFRAQPWAITLLLHNGAVMLYSVLTLWVAFRVYRQPTRSRLRLLYGGLLLIAAFEYAKHAVGQVRGTLAYLLDPQVNASAHDLLQLLLVEWLPVALYLGGVALVLSSVVPGGWRLRRHPPTRVQVVPE